MNVVEKRKNWENAVSWYKKMRQIQHINLLPTEHISLISYLKNVLFSAILLGKTKCRRS